MAKEKAPVTPAVRALRAAGVTYTEHLYPYEDKGGTASSARHLGVDEHIVVKTLVMEDEDKQPLIVLMHGDKQVGTGLLAKAIGRKKIQPCAPAVAEKHTGYQVGGTSPFGTRRAMPVFVEATILDLPRIVINGGKRGFLVGLSPAALAQVLSPTPVRVAVDG